MRILTKTGILNIKLIIAVFSFFALTACASTHMKQYISQDIREVVLDSGPPINVFDLTDGKRAFQFRWGGGSYVVPTHTTTTGVVTAVGNNAWYSSSSLTTGGGVISSEGCIISYITSWDEARDAWIVTNYRIPKQLVC